MREHKGSSFKTLIEILIVSTRLGFTSFGGPIAHLGYFYEEYLRKRKWLDEKSYADLVALCQFLPGPASSQVGIGLGVMRGGLLGGVVSFLGFMLRWLSMFDSFYRAGSLVFGGGHVVLPLLEQEFVPAGMVSKEAFLAGYGAAQAVPGPLFTFAAYLGAVMGGWQGGTLAAIAIFLPAFLLILGALPYWDTLRRNPKLKGALAGVNAAVVGILISAFYFPIWTSAILNQIDFAFAAVLFSMLAYWKLPPWVVVVTGVIGGFLLSLL